MTWRIPCTVEGCGRKIHGRGFCNLHYKRWKEHGDPTVRLIRDAGEGTPHNSGYWVLTINGQSKLRHIAIAEKALGRPLPDGAEVHHMDRNRANDSPGNLVICPSREYHKLLHRRMDSYDACGRWDWRKCWVCKEYDDPINLVDVTKNVMAHRACQSAYAKRRRECRTHSAKL